MIEKRIVRKNEVLKRLGIRKTTFYETFIKTGRLRFVKISARAVGVIEDELDALIEELRRERVAARALEFTILTAARTGEVVGARWTELTSRLAPGSSPQHG